MQQHKTNMINEEWNKTQNDAPFVAFYDMCAVTFVLPNEMANVSMAGLQWFILIPRLNHTGSHRPTDSIPYLHRGKKNIGFGMGNKPFENTEGKGEIACNEQFLFFPTVFSTILWITFCHFHQISNCRLQTLSVWKSLKFVVW